MNKNGLLSWIEISRKALDKNVKSLARLAGKRKIFISVKANAYGHGLPQIIEFLNDRDEIAGVTVHSLEEAAVCRDHGWTRPIMMVGPTPLKRLEQLFELDLEPVILNRETLDGIGKLTRKLNRKIKTHLKLETGTHRQGVTEKELPGLAKIYARYPGLKKAYGASMHFANIEDTTNHGYAQEQLSQFRKMLAHMGQLGIRPTVRHTACSAALILFDKTRFELVRPGISFYGHWPSKETYLSYRLAGGENSIFEPALTWKTRVTQIKDLPADSFVGYGCTYRTTARTKLAVLPIGYSDGYDRALSNTAHVLIKGKRAPVRGRVCMNLCMVDITDIPGVKLEDEVVLIGRQRSGKVTSEMVSSWYNTIAYSVLGGLSPNLPRLLK